MKNELKKIQEYLESDEVDFEYIEKEDLLLVPIMSHEEKTIFESIGIRYDLIYIQITIQFTNVFSNDLKYRLSEYLHRANYDMIRGSFEYNVDENIISFKHYFENSVISNKNYTIYNVILPAMMFKKYMSGIPDIFETDISTKEIIDKIEENDK